MPTSSTAVITFWLTTAPVRSEFLNEPALVPAYAQARQRFPEVIEPRFSDLVFGEPQHFEAAQFFEMLQARIADARPT